MTKFISSLINQDNSLRKKNLFSIDSKYMIKWVQQFPKLIPAETYIQQVIWKNLKIAWIMQQYLNWFSYKDLLNIQEHKYDNRLPGNLVTKIVSEVISLIIEMWSNTYFYLSSFKLQHFLTSNWIENDYLEGQRHTLCSGI